MRRDTFKQKIDSINYYLSGYDTLSPFCDDGNCYEQIETVQGKIISGLLDVLNDRRILSYDLSKTFNQNSLYHSSSSDGRVHFFTIDAKNGGSWQMQLTILHTHLKNGAVRAVDLSKDYSYASFGNIQMVDSTNSTYVAIGGVTTCNTCIAMMALTIQPESMQLPEIVCSLDSRTNNDYDITYDPSTKIISYFHTIVTNDPLGGSPDASFEYGENDFADQPLKITYHKEIAYRNGKFVTIKACWSSEEL